MKILWITNTVFPEAATALGKPSPVVGGWMYGLAKDLSKSNIQLVVATVVHNEPDQEVLVDNTKYYLLQGKKSKIFYDKSLEPKWKLLVQKEKPDLVHIHGTEYAHGLALLRSCENLQRVISIQGLIGVIYRYYNAGIGLKDILRNITLRDVLKQDSILNARSSFKKRFRLVESEYLKNATNIIGRTQWDHDHTSASNPKAAYHFCNESLRDAFYNSQKWELQNVRRYSIFLSQAGYPIKGLHKVLEAVALIVSELPEIHINIAGNNILMNDGGLKKKLKRTGYGKYVHSLIQSNNLEKHITFLGFLNAEQMVEQYLQSHVFICPSSIENSPNSLGEAQLLGVPCIASYVGGVPSFVQNGETGLLYRFEEVEMLAQHLLRIFNQDALSHKLSKNGISVAEKRHHRKTNCEKLIAIYREILNV